MARWVDVDLEAGVLRLANPKGNRPDEVALTGRAVAAFRLAATFTQGRELCFAGSSQGSPVSIASLADRVFARAQLDGVRLHDLRRSVAVLLSSRVDAFACAAVMGHKLGTITERYAVVDLARKRAALELVGDEIARLAGLP